MQRTLIALLLTCAALPAVEYDGFVGYWVTVEATAYTPTDPHDGDYHATKGADRWMTAGRISDVRKVPHNIAAPFRAGEDGLRNVPMFVDYRTRVLIPKGYGYLDRLRPEDRVFTVDDTGGKITELTMKSGRVHLDLRFESRKDALKWAGPTGKRTIRVFVVTGDAPGRPAAEPRPVWPSPILELPVHRPPGLTYAPVPDAPRRWTWFQTASVTLLIASLAVFGALLLVPQTFRRGNEQ